MLESCDLLYSILQIEMITKDKNEYESPLFEGHELKCETVKVCV